jgi:hypothetical protein
MFCLFFIHKVILSLKKARQLFLLCLKEPLNYLLGGLLPLPPLDGLPVLLGALFGVPALHILKVIITSPLNHSLKRK